MIKDTVEKLINKYKTNSPFILAHKLKVNIIYENLGETMGYFTNDYRIKFIHINNTLSEDECRFTCAHELGHAILHPNVNTPFLKRYTLYSIDRIERQANAFAVELLMPDKLLHEHPECSFYDIAGRVGIPPKLVVLKKQ
ncbi:ImmA/IrrE family metallo-endopeptidase [Propionispora vibrioides]|uniref:IrrE N-terminal-like domain-containing protein n=1 Tax=Propionispora vibrioides TaxID=112903 RepID=A0A1H8ULG0_9FIRM|nr:ImmA/IrrE family metallo-endopeptidase [Propionispora vibrioides]SEP04049.1 protein of unknown function [Propionispora vibrioides]